MYQNLYNVSICPSISFESKHQHNRVQLKGNHCGSNVLKSSTTKRPWPWIGHGASGDIFPERLIGSKEQSALQLGPLSVVAATQWCSVFTRTGLVLGDLALSRKIESQYRAHQVGGKGRPARRYCQFPGQIIFLSLFLCVCVCVCAPFLDQTPLLFTFANSLLSPS